MTRRNAWPVSATYRGEEIEVTFTATAQRDWIGDASVPNGTQECIDIDNIEVDTVTILGVTVDYDKLPDDLQTAISVLSDEVEFEND